MERDFSVGFLGRSVALLCSLLLKCALERREREKKIAKNEQTHQSARGPKSPERNLIDLELIEQRASYFRVLDSTRETKQFAKKNNNYKNET